MGQCFLDKADLSGADLTGCDFKCQTFEAKSALNSVDVCGTVAAAACEDGSVCIFDYEASRLLAKIQLGAAAKQAVFSCGGDLVAVCCADKQLYVVDCMLQLVVAKADVGAHTVCFCGDLVACGCQSSVKLLNTKGEVLKEVML